MSNSTEHYSSENAVKGSEVFVGGLPRTLTEDKIREVFSTCGEILEIRLIKDQKGSLKGFCFVRFATKAAADKAVREKSGLLLDGKKIGVLPSVEQDTLFMGNLYKGWTAEEFSILVRQVFPDVVSVDLATPFSTGESPPGQKKQNRGFAFVKFSSHAAAARAHRAGSSPEFCLGKIHPAVEWAEEDPEVNPEDLAKVKIAFIRNLPGGADENFLKKLFVPLGQVEKVIISNKTRSPVGFIHFAERSDLDDAIREMNGKTVHGPNGGPPFKLLVEVARPMDKSKKRAREDPQSQQSNKVSVHSKLVTGDPAFSAFASPMGITQQEAAAVDPYETAVGQLPVAVKERLLRILRLGIATRFDISIECLTSLKELPDSTAISVLDQFMLSGADKNNKGAYLTALISKHHVEKLGQYGFHSSLFRVREMPTKDSELSSFSSRAQLPAFDSVSSHQELAATRSDGHTSRYSYMYSDYPLPSRASNYPLSGRASDYPLPSRASDYPLPSRASDYILPSRASDYPLPSRASDYPLPSGASFGRLQEASPASLHLTPGPSTPYGKNGPDSHLTTAAYHQRPDSHLTTAANRQAARPQMRFDPFTGEPYKFDPFTGEPIRPESPQRHFRSPY